MRPYELCGVKTVQVVIAPNVDTDLSAHLPPKYACFCQICPFKKKESVTRYIAFDYRAKGDNYKTERIVKIGLQIKEIWNVKNFKI